MNWIHQNIEIENINQIPETALAFIYRIERISDGKFYVGRKMLSSNRKVRLTKKEKLLPENKRKIFKRVIKETDWKDYWGSSKELLEDIKLLGKESFKREILCFTTSKSDTSFYEMFYQMKFNVLFENSYNGHIANTKFFKGKISQLSNEMLK
jgi:hypothetical protein